MTIRNIMRATAGSLRTLGQAVLWGGLLALTLDGLGAGLGCSHSSNTSAPGQAGAVPQIPSAQDFQTRVVQSPRPVLVDFFATWCGPCKEFAPTVEALAKEYAGRVDFFEVDVDQVADLAREHHVSAIPTVELYNQGRVVGRWTGVQTDQTLRSALNLALEATKGTPLMTPQTTQPATAGTVTFKGTPMTLLGTKVQVGQKAPDFTVLGNDLKDMTFRAAYKGKVVILAPVPSLDTSVCDIETRRFNEEAAKLGDQVAVLTISMDLPFAQKRWCGAHGIEAVKTFSDHRDASFGLAYGVLIQELRLLARAVFVVDRDGIVRYVQVVGEIAKEPDYAAALEAAGKLK